MGYNRPIGLSHKVRPSARLVSYVCHAADDFSTKPLSGKRDGRTRGLVMVLKRTARSARRKRRLLIVDSHP